MAAFHPLWTLTEQAGAHYGHSLDGGFRPIADIRFNLRDLLRRRRYCSAMPAFTSVSTSRLGAEPTCETCRAGGVVSFNWDFAQERGSAEDLDRVAPFVPWKDLRRGTLFRCNVCGQVWHLDGGGQIMTHVADERLPLVLQWNEEPIALTEDLQARLEQIGPTPPDVYGNWSDRRVTPCRVATITGEVVDPAMVCVQLEAPIQVGMDFRLGNEVADVTESEFALPLDVRLASSRAEEMRNGFSPSLIQMPDGNRFVLNGMTSFMAEQGYKAGDARTALGNYFGEDPPPAFVREPAVTYFVVDGDPGWIRQQPSRLLGGRPAAWLRRNFQR